MEFPIKFDTVKSGWSTVYIDPQVIISKKYGKSSKISNTFLFLFTNLVFIIRAGIHKMVVRIANREDPDQTASSEAV